MVNKRGLNSKIFFIFFSTLLLTFASIVCVVIITLKKVAVTEVFYRLTAYCDVTYNDWSNGKEIVPHNLKSYGIIQGKIIDDNLIVEYSKTESYFSEQEYVRFLQTINRGLGEYKDTNNEKFYYIYELNEENDSFVIMVVNDDYSKDFTKRVVGLMLIIVIISLILVSIIISYAITRITNRIKRIQEHVKTMNKNQYDLAYIDDGDDEISDLSYSIEEMRKEIKDSEMVKREMLQNISHDLKTPIAVIKNYGEAILDGIQLPNCAEVIVNQADILKSKVNQLLQYNRLEYLSHEKEFELINLKDVCQEVINNRKLETNLTIESHLDDCYLKGFRENYNTIVDNIVDNALRYAKTKIVITTKKNKISIYNDGDPIEEQFLSGNFKAYEKGAKGQFGLGMSIVQKTVEFFDLKLNVYNESYGGVTFVISKKE